MSLRTPSQQRNDKYMNALLYACQQREFTGSEFREAFKINHNVLTAMNELGIVHKFKPGHYRYQLMRPPTKIDVETIQKRLRAYQSVTDEPSKQLIIQPMKRAERTQPVPVQEEVIHDTSNSKIVLILAVGAVIGFLIATLIWK